ncbi:MAG: hypothetical protein QXK69_12090 [Candidatus Caldarchaeum sp.]
MYERVKKLSVVLLFRLCHRELRFTYIMKVQQIFPHMSAADKEGTIEG